MILVKKIRASALQLVILISVIIALLLGSFLLLTNTHQFFKIQSNEITEVIDKSVEGVYRALNSELSLTSKQDTLPQSAIATITSDGFHGAFMKIESTSEIGDKSFTSIALAGAISDKSRTALYVSDNRRPLKLVADSRIIGDAYVTETGIVPGTINKIKYSGNELVRGSIKRSNRVLPSLLPDWLEYIKSFRSRLVRNGSPSKTISDVNLNSFHQPLDRFYKAGKIRIRQKFAGNIAVISDTEIVITKEADLADILVVAPKVTVQKGFKGSVHIVSDESVLIEPNAQLLYPSSIVVVKNDYKPLAPIERGEEPIVISDRSLIEGILFFDQRKGKDNSVTNGIWIQPNAVVKGEVYCIGSMELSGTIQGSVFAESFIANEFGSKYYNHIYNGSIRSNELSEAFGGLPLLNSKKTVVKWLY